MNKAKYIPQPIDTKDVKSPEELGQLVEQMPKNVHEVWAERVFNKDGSVVSSAMTN